MIDKEKVKDAFSNCIAEPKCKDCPWEKCESFTEKRIRIPASLCHDVMEMLIDAPTIVPNNTMPTIGGWISVKDRLPEFEEKVIVARYWTDDKNKRTAYVEVAERVDDDYWVSDSDEYKIMRNRHSNPYAWMPIPNPPKEEEFDETD